MSDKAASETANLSSGNSFVVAYTVNLQIFSQVVTT